MKIKIEDQKKLKALEKLIGPIEKFEGTYLGKYGARLTAISPKGLKQSIELSCGRLGAYDKYAKIKNTMTYEEYCENIGMDWTHLISAGLEMPHKWYRHN